MKPPIKLLYNPRDNFRLLFKSWLAGFLILACSGSILTLTAALYIISRLDLDTMGYNRSKVGDSPIFNLPTILIGNVIGLLCNPFLNLPTTVNETWWVYIVKGLGFGAVVGLAKEKANSYLFWILLLIALESGLVCFNMLTIEAGFLPWILTLIGNIVGLTWVKKFI